MNLRLRRWLILLSSKLRGFCAQLLLAQSLFVPIFLATAEPIYQWIDANGRVHYGNQPHSADVSEAALPELGRENIDQKIEEIRDATPENCINRGGVDCSKGSDFDGSVICYDGYRDAILPFRFACVAARLSINSVAIVLVAGAEDSEIVDLKELNKPNAYSLRNSQITLLIRNDTEIMARKVSVLLKLPVYGHVVARGPETIEPHGVAEYIFLPEKISGPFNVEHAKKLSAVVRCENCNQNDRYVQ